MADINIVQAHQLAPEQARAAAQQVVDKLAEQFELSCRWEGDELHFDRTGVNGKLTLAPNEARVQLTLGLFYGAFAGVVEAKLKDKMARVFAG